MHNDNLAKDIHLTFLLPQQKVVLFVLVKIVLLSHISLSLQIVDMKVPRYMQKLKNNILCRALELP